MQDPLHCQFVSCLAHPAFGIPTQSSYIAIGGGHDLLESCKNFFFRPGIVAQVLAPFEITDDDAACVRKDVGYDGYLPFEQNGIRFCGKGSVRHLQYD